MIDNFTALNLPEVKLRLKDTNNHLEVFDICRSKYVKLTSEEWVRQHYIHFLINQLGFSKNLIAVEQTLAYNALMHRPDLTVYDKQGHPYAIIECKKPSVKIDKQVFLQVSRYNIALKAPYLVLTNGLHHFYFYLDRENQKFSQVETLPYYP